MKLRKKLPTVILWTPLVRHDCMLFMVVEIVRPAVAKTSSTFWKGGFTFEGQFVCNLVVLCKPDQLTQSSLGRPEWPKMLEGVKMTTTPPIPADTSSMLQLAPEKNEPAFYVFVSNLEKTNSVRSSINADSLLLVGMSNQFTWPYSVHRTFSHDHSIPENTQQEILTVCLRNS